MALTKPIGFLCYNNSELVRDGYIEPVMSFEHDASNFNFNKLKSNRKGVSYQIIRDESNPDNISKIIEKRRQLPADKIKIEIQFSKTLKNAVTHPISPGIIPGLAGSIITPMLGGLGFGGITSGYTDFVYDIIDSEMIINEKIKITQEILDTGIITFNAYPVSIFGIVKEYKEELADEDAATEFKKTHPQGRVGLNQSTGLLMGIVGLDFTGDQLDKIGQNSRGSYQGGPRKRIDGATDSTGQFGTLGNAYIQIVANIGDSGNPSDQEVLLLEGQENIFLEIIRDDRKLKFRGDNPDASGQRWYPFKNGEVDDITDHDIRIKVDDLNIDDIIYITYCSSKNRRVRQAMRHKGTVGQGNTFGVSGWNLEIGSEMDIFDYQIRSWIVPKDIPEYNDPDNNFKISFSRYQDWKNEEQKFNKSIQSSATSQEAEQLEQDKQAYFDKFFNLIEGWRMSSIITTRLEVMWAADYRGIVLMGDRKPAVVVVPFSQIRDQEWFLNYVKGLDFIEKHVDSVTGETIYDNIEIKIDDAIKLEDMPESPIDIGNPNNEFLFDREKIPYYRDFALALQNVSTYDKDNSESGVGIPSLDLTLKTLLDNGNIDGVTSDVFYKGSMSNYLSAIESAFNSSLNLWGENILDVADLSFSDFQWSQSVPTFKSGCAEGYPIQEYNYTCHTYDTGNGPGVWLTTSYIENQVLEWRPPGGFIESYWKMDTPYFCGDFGRTSRIYIEKVGGNSLDNFSWIYVDTWADIPEVISLDKNTLTGQSFLTFYDDIHKDCAAYHIFSDSYLSDSYRFLNVNTDKTHSRDFLNANGDEDKMIEIHNNQKIIGYNNILGDSPSYNMGKMLNFDSSYACKNEITYFWETVDILKGTNPYGKTFELDLSDNIPRIKNIPSFWAIKEINLEYKISNGETITPNESLITLYFEENDVSINNILMNTSKTNTNLNTKETIDCQYYSSGTIQLLGDFWKKIDITKFEAIISNTTDLENVKIKEGQTSVINGPNGKIMVFFSDTTSGNISLAMSYNEGYSWMVHRNIIRLISSENASLPIAIQDTQTNTIHLFYVLNDAFLMYLPINPDLFVSQDIWVEYTPPDFYDETSTDDNEEDINSSLHNFTTYGINLRRQVSYFVAGDSNSAYFQDQIEITNNIIINNKITGGDQNIRFNFIGALEDMDEGFNGKNYAVHIDDSGIMKLFFTNELGLTIKMSRDYRRLEYLSKNLSLHKTYLDPDIKEEETPVISNIQVARNYYSEASIYLFYFYRGMLLMRILSPDALRVIVNQDGSIDDSTLRGYITITSDSYSSLPIFIVGSIPDDILSLRIQELEEESLTGQTVDSKIAIRFFYGLDDIKKFNENFELDVSTQVFAYVTKNGSVRTFYKDALGNLNGVYITGNQPTPEIFFELK